VINRIRLVAVGGAAIVAGILVPISPASASDAACTPSVSLAQPYTDTAGVTHFVFDYQTCGPEMALKLKSRPYHEGRYETFISGPVSGSGQVDYKSSGCGGEPPVKSQFIGVLKIGSVLYARSAPKTYTIPYRPCA
jgi:hypothetical protein